MLPRACMAKAEGREWSEGRVAGILNASDILLLDRSISSPRGNNERKEGTGSLRPPLGWDISVERKL